MRGANKCEELPVVSRRIRSQMLLQNKDMEYVAAQIGWCQTKLYRLLKNPLSMSLQDFLGICKTLKLNPLRVLCEDVLYWKWEEQGK